MLLRPVARIGPTGTVLEAGYEDRDHFWTLYVLMSLSGWELGDRMVIGWSECFVVLETFFFFAEYNK